MLALFTINEFEISYHVGIFNVVVSLVSVAFFAGSAGIFNSVVFSLSVALDFVVVFNLVSHGGNLVVVVF